eukprot:TRINITY_DN19820_c0_g1_i1.p1 TRINITY_DN19820_c0_g1~~TRINITY_DN19820_c0_g1_i1.p1  ORF type:complete len:140 (+),score=2.42 TRINITY_DN19820_c0_g1_i1:72-491(+)
MCDSTCFLIDFIMTVLLTLFARPCVLSIGLTNFLHQAKNLAIRISRFKDLFIINYMFGYIYFINFAFPARPSSPPLVSYIWSNICVDLTCILISFLLLLLLLQTLQVQVFFPSDSSNFSIKLKIFSSISSATAICRTSF